MKKSNKSTREATRDVIYEKIDLALADIKGNVREKKFDKKLQKVSDVLAKDIAKAAKKQDPKNKKQKSKGKKSKGKKSKSEKILKSAKINPLKMNNLPVTPEVQPVPNQIVP